MLLPTSKILLYGTFGSEVISERTPELLMLCIHCTIAIFILIRYHKTTNSFDIKKDNIAWIVPMTFNLLYVVVAFTRGLSEAYAPMIAGTLLHAIYMAYIFRGEKPKMLMSKA